MRAQPRRSGLAALLGRSATAVRTLDAHVRRGDVNGGGRAARGRAFRRDLLRFLRRHGYR